ncbi:hypothetical protein D3C72_1763890 [compost metagenome]
MRVRVADQGDIIPHLQHCITVRVSQNTVAANTFDIAARLAVDTQFAQVFAVGPGNQLRPDAIGANDGQIDFTFGVGVQTALARNLLGAGLEILMLEFRQVTRSDDKAHQPNQIGQGVAETQVVERQRKLTALHTRVAQRITRTDQHRRRSHRTGQHPGG